MPGDYLPHDLKALWQELDANPLERSPDQLRQEVQKLRIGLRRRSIFGAGAALFVMICWTRSFFVDPNWLQRLGSILTVLGAGYMIVQLRMRPSPAMPNFGETASIPFYRAELERQRDFHRGKWLWSRLLIFLPGPLLWCAGFAQAKPGIAAAIWVDFALLLILAPIAVLLNLRLAAKYQRRIDALNAGLGIGLNTQKTN